MAADRNSNYLFVTTGVSTYEQLYDSIVRCLKERNLYTDFKISIVGNREGLCGYAYVWIKDKEIYRMLSDEEAVQVIPDPNWRAPDISMETALAELDQNFNDDDYDTCWEKLTALGDARRTVEERYKPDMITVRKEPILKLSPFKLTEEQRQYYQRRQSLQDNVDIPNYIEYITGPAFYAKDKNSYNQDVLVTDNLPYWLTEIDLKRLFEPYVDDTTTQHKISINKMQVEGTYPFISINSTRGGRDKLRAYVYFDPLAGEGRMVILMSKKVSICKSMSDGTVMTSILYFKHPTY